MRFAFYELTLRDDILVAERVFAAKPIVCGCEAASISDLMPDESRLSDGIIIIKRYLPIN